MVKKRTIYFIHYHFIKGGVTTVIKNQIEVLKEEFNIVLIGSKKIGEPSKLDFNNITFLNLEELDYQYYEKLDFEEFQKTKNKILNFLNNNIDPVNGILFVHNYNLGKNVSFTQALLEFITEKNIPTFLQIHDFPECARWENYKFIKKFINLPLYPAKNNIKYILINKDDYNRILKTKINNNNVFYLPNPVNLNNRNNIDIGKGVYKNFSKNIDKNIDNTKNDNTNKNINKEIEYNINKNIDKKTDNNLDYNLKYNKKFSYNNEKVLENLYKIANDEGFNFNPELPIVLYPVRTIRRKNILEAILIARIYKDKINLLVTLPANSVKERKYEEIVKKSFKNKNFYGMWGISKKYPQYFNSIVSISKLFLSTSVLEGFGLMFIEAISKGKSFFARNINVMKDFPFITENMVYKNFIVPVNKKTKDKYIKLYLNKINSLPVEITFKKKLALDLYSLFNNDTLDFSYFSYEDQYLILQNKELINEISRLNRSELNKFENLLTISKNNYDIKQDSISYFSLTSYKEKLLRIINVDNDTNQNNCDNDNVKNDKKFSNTSKNGIGKDDVTNSKIDNNVNNKILEKIGYKKDLEKYNIEKEILESFLKFEYLRLLFD